MSFFAEYGIFLAKTLTIVIAIIMVLIAIIIAKKAGAQISSEDDLIIQTKDLNNQFKDLTNDVRDAVFEDDKARSEYHKQKKKDEKKQLKETKKKRKNSEGDDKKPLLYVLDFEGDIEANSAESLRTLISIIIDTADEKTSVLLRLESPGGAVNAYGLAASQLNRLRQRDIPLTIAVDKVAASGGYMMASVANKILAAPFSIIGSIGVVTSIPNFNRLLKEKNIDYEQITAGEFKRTLTIFGENDDASRKKVKEELDSIHQLFKDHISQYRPDLDMKKVATGEIWLGSQAKELGLIDEITTSDDFLMERLKDSRVIHLSEKEKKSLAKRLGLPLGRVKKSLIPYIS